MSEYRPPYTIDDRMLMLVGEISEKIGRVGGSRMLETKPHLRRNNRIRSVHSSLKIEANSLSLGEVRDVLNGKTVTGPQKEIAEVKNAFRAYEEIGTLDPFSTAELRRLHGIMTELTVTESGRYRSGEEGVFRGGRCIFAAPPPQLVPELVEELFGWMRSASETVHPLILSSVFHYEFVFIHPFSDGNGRMARLWQTALLSRWNGMFAYLPIESRIAEYQEQYYAAIEECNANGNSNAFILFMLEMISGSLDAILQQLRGEDAALSACVRKLLDAMEYDIPYSAAQLMAKLGLRSRDTLRKHYLDPALQNGLIVMGEPDKPTSRNQTYIRK